MWKSCSGPILWTLLAILLLTACQPIRPDQDSNTEAEQTKAAAAGLTEPAESAVTPMPAAPATLLTLQPASAEGVRTAAEIFTAISPAVAFVDTPMGTGSGVLIQGGYLLTNAHVVWPFSAVRVVFPDGSEYVDTPVVGWDLIADLALVGPIETEIEPAPLVDAGELAIGSDVYLIGYPAEEETFPQPSITYGILSAAAQLGNDRLYLLPGRCSYRRRTERRRSGHTGGRCRRHFDLHIQRLRTGRFSRRRAAAPQHDTGARVGRDNRGAQLSARRRSARVRGHVAR